MIKRSINLMNVDLDNEEKKPIQKGPDFGDSALALKPHKFGGGQERR